MKNQIEIKKVINPFNKQIEVSGDKSISIRCVLLASQAIGKSKIYNLLESEDVINSLKAIKRLGISYKKMGKYYEICGYGINSYQTKKKLTINAGNSGTLARLILGLLVDSKNEVKIIGDKSLSNRDFSRITNPLKLFGANILSKKDTLPVKILGSEFLRPIKYKENLGSAQCKSSVLLAALKTPGITKVLAKKSRDHTELMFKHLKIPIKIINKNYYDIIEINGPHNFQGFEYKVPADISSSSFFIVLALLSKKSQVVLKNVNVNNSRTGIIKILNRMNAKIILKNKKIYNGERIADIVVKSQNNLRGIDCPKNLNSSAIDEFLVIFLAAAKAKGVSSFKDLSELNKKESPRLEIAIDILNQIGIKFTRKKDNIKIYGNPNLKLSGKYIIKGFKKDHRVFMMSCIAALTFGGHWKINDKNSIKTSFPSYIKLLKKLGAKIIDKSQ
tara:strand:- start:4925 stop:6262 length:1338 start_codon:yes stop_codon:yes gene_type:complete